MWSCGKFWAASFFRTVLLKVSVLLYWGDCILQLTNQTEYGKYGLINSEKFLNRMVILLNPFTPGSAYKRALGSYTSKPLWRNQLTRNKISLTCIWCTLLMQKVEKKNRRKQVRQNCRAERRAELAPCVGVRCYYCNRLGLFQLNCFLNGKETWEGLLVFSCLNSNLRIWIEISKAMLV